MACSSNRAGAFFVKKIWSWMGIFLMSMATIQGKEASLKPEDEKIIPFVLMDQGTFYEINEAEMMISLAQRFEKISQRYGEKIQDISLQFVLFSSINCPPCQALKPYGEEFLKKYWDPSSPNFGKNFPLFLINVDAEKEEKFYQDQPEWKQSFQGSLYNKKGEQGDLAWIPHLQAHHLEGVGLQDFQMGVPVLMVVQNGMVLKRYEGYQAIKDLLERVEISQEKSLFLQEMQRIFKEKMDLLSRKSAQWKK